MDYFTRSSMLQRGENKDYFKKNKRTNSPIKVIFNLYTCIISMSICQSNLIVYVYEHLEKLCKLCMLLMKASVA